MGESMLKALAKNFTHQQNNAFTAEFKERSLFHERREVYATDYPCQPCTNDMVVFEGQEVMVRKKHQSSILGDDSSNLVEVLAGNLLVAYVKGEHGKTLCDIIDSDPRSANCFPAKVVNFSPLDGHFSIRYLHKDDVHHIG